MSKHTPGPWKTWSKPAGRGTVPFIVPAGDADDEAIAQVFGGGRTEAERGANALLIVAAPEMLQALKSVAARNALPKSEADWIKLQEIVSAAIARAEGK